MTNLMNIHTGSVDTLENWQSEFESMSTEDWGSEEFNNGNLVEVQLDEDGNWFEAD